MPMQNQVGPFVANDGAVSNMRADNYGSSIVQQFNGKYAEQARRGQLFNASVAAAAAILLTNTTANGPTLWNPLGSGVILYINQLYLTWVSGTITVSGLIWNITRNAGAQAATGAPILTVTPVATRPCMEGSSSVSKAIWAPVTTTYTAAPSFLRATGISMIAAGQTAVIEQDYDGTFAVMPGNAVTLNCAVATTTAIFWTTIIYSEVPIPAGVL
jgi:hypothetical protein